MALININGVEYFVDQKLMELWSRNSLDKLRKANNDRVYIVDGRERIGKSTWTFQQAGALDKEMFKSPEDFVKRVCFTPTEFFDAVREIKNGVIIFDESFRGFSSRGTLSKTNKKLVQALMEMGQNNNIVFIVLPSFFLLDIYPAMLRSDGLFNIYMDKKNSKRAWRGYNKKTKNQIFQMGTKKGWSYNIPTNFKGRFYGKFPGGEEFERAYIEKKAKAIREMDQEDKMSKRELKWKEQRDLLIKLIAKFYPKYSHAKLADYFKQVGLDISRSNIQIILEDNR